MPITQTPLRYPGGKSALSSYVKNIFIENDLVGGHYVEPYAGGAGLALGLLYNNYASDIHLNDLNTAVHNFWYVALHHNEDLCQLIEGTDVSIDEWHKQNKQYAQPVKDNRLAHAFSTFFLNRTNRSGILTAGVIGGKGQNGNYKLDARYNKKTLIRKLKQILAHKSRIHLYNLDAADLIVNVLTGLPEQTLIYCDPPYYVKGQNLYQNHYLHDDHTTIANLIQEKSQHRWMVSYDNVPQIAKLYSDRRHITYNLNYSAQRHIPGSEIIIFSDDLVIPDIKNPAKAAKVA
jgi:DNA adenine methylase